MNWMMVLGFFFSIGSVVDLVEIKLVRKPDIFKPGKNHTLIMSLENQSKDTIDVVLELELPDKWVVLTQNKKITLLASQTKNSFINVTLPKDYPPGKQVIKVKVLVDNQIIKTQEIVAEVQKIQDLDIRLLDHPEYVISEDEFHCVYLLTNRGNIQEDVLLSSINGVIDGALSNTIGINESIEVKVNQTTPLISVNQIAINDLNVESKTFNNKLYKNVRVNVFPKPTKSKASYFRYPIRANLKYNYFGQGDQSMKVAQYNVHGNGFLDREQKYHLEILSKGTDHQREARFDNYKQHMVKFSAFNKSVTLGDFRLSLTRLLEKTRLGRGVMFDKHGKQFRFKGFYNTLPFLPEVRSQLGVSAEYETKNSVFVKVGSMYRVYEGTEDYSLTNSLSMFYNSQKLSYNIESAISQREGVYGYGAAAGMMLKIKKLQLASDTFFTSADFQGFYNNSLFFSNAIQYKLSYKLMLISRLNYNLINPRSDLIFEQVAPFYQNYSVGFRYVPNKTQWHSISVSRRSNFDRSSNYEFDYLENLFIYSYSYKNQRFSGRLFLDYAKTLNRITGDNNEDDFNFDTRINLRYTPFKQLSFGILTEYIKTNRYHQDSQTYLFYGANLSYKRNTKLKLSVNYRNNFPLEDFYKSNNFFDFTCNYQPFYNHSFQFLSRYSNQQGSYLKKDLYLALQYNFNLFVPLKKDKNLGFLKGKITSKGLPKKDVIVNLSGRLAITDEQGQYVFDNLPLGPYILTIDSQSVDSNLVANRSLPLNTEVESDLGEVVDIDLVEASQVSGEIKFVESNRHGSDKFKSNLPNLLIKISNSQFSTLTQMDHKGSFLFKQLLPGKWRVEIIKNGLEKKYDFANSIREVSLESGQKVHHKFEVKTKKRKINFSNKKFKITTD